MSRTPEPVRTAVAPTDRPSRRALAWRRVILVIVGIAYGIGLGIVLFWPVHVDGEGGLIRVDGVIDLLGRLGVPAGVRYPLVQNSLNAALFLPFGLLWAAWFRRPRAHLAISAALLAGAASLAAEIIQYRYLPDRTFDLRDVVANAAGAALGALAYAIAAQVVRQRRRR
ncbi:VanZ family protein [Agromyces sp. SYSU T0242]|uniref:VanZ family protein n=1 Tax=Agromyces litoreus TaxID=3158561 RepID=UPI003397F2BD